VAELGSWHADAAGECWQPDEGVAAVGTEEVFGYLVNGGTVADLGGGGALGGQQRAEARVVLHPRLQRTRRLSHLRHRRPVQRRVLHQPHADTLIAKLPSGGLPALYAYQGSVVAVATATLIYAGRDRRSVIRRMVPLT
jgi:hypothetical protein